ncbi:carboxypeptidase-like regulatory domain-containing protein [Flavobacteriales bacterium]|nr:carboxypeptidase-like regulatory domain-containing protein [Flavobacteriales bacterium]
MKRGIILFSILISPFIFLAQTTQTVRGKIVDKETFSPIIGATILVITETTKTLGASTDLDGNYRIDGVSLGRHKIKISYVGYYDQIIPVVINAGKELILNAGIEESFKTLKTVEITGDDNGGVKNDMALASVTSFSVEETKKYAGSRDDPARMASNFAGVQGADDSRNDIVVRGNSPLGVLWRVEGIDIPNPNHFSIAGSSGGPVSILNNKLMANSDFFTAAFPAEYGNSVAGVFDLKLRNGNNQKHEFSGQFGFLGTEIMAEGPINKKTGSSYLFAYRYSTLAMFESLNIKVGTDAIPQYQDLSLKLNFPQKKGGTISLFAITGLSSIDIMFSDEEKPNPDLNIYGENDRDQHFSTAMGVAGLTYLKPLKKKAFWKTTIAGAVEQQKATHNYFTRTLMPDGNYRLDDIYTILDYRFRQYKVSAASYINKKLNSKSVLKYGLNADFFIYNFHDSVYKDNATPKFWDVRWDHNGTAALIQPYAQLKHKFTERFVMNFGVHAQAFTQSESISWLEPRISMRYNLDEKQILSSGVGLHSQIQPSYTYFYQIPTGVGTEESQHNNKMDFTKSIHSVVGYSNAISKKTFLKSEVYYQYLYNVPVEVNPSSFSMLNQGSGFSRFFPDSIENSGTGNNYGLELTVKHNFDASFYIMITGAVYNSKYKGSDGVERNTDFNGNFAGNLLIGKEFKLGKRGTALIGANITWAGGKRYGLVDTTASAAAREVIFLDDQYNEKQFDNYFRADFKLNYKLNTSKLTHEFGLDLVNAFGIENILALTYAPTPDDPARITTSPQLGFLPLFYYRIDF